MYIINATRQHLRLNLRVPESRKTLVVEIASGHQEEVGKDWNAPQRDVIVQTLERYGARKRSEVSGSLKKFNGILYAFDRPASEGEIHAAHDAVIQRQKEVASDEITKAALSASAATRRVSKRRARKSALEVTQVGDSEKINMAVEVSPNGHDDPGLNG